MNEIAHEDETGKIIVSLGGDASNVTDQKTKLPQAKQLYRHVKPVRPDFDDPYEAARVHTFMLPCKSGDDWKLDIFTIDEQQAEIDRLRQMARMPDTVDRDARVVPPGEYAAIYHWTYEEEAERDLWIPVMSDTPDEISDHAHPIEHATGRVLVHGLGLGMIVSALLAKPDVEHIDVVELNQRVIDITGPYYNDSPRVTIHRGDAAKKRWPEGTRWNYAWHDIWYTVSPRNLNDRNPEHGISYRRMFDLFADRCDIQQAWAFDLAREIGKQWERDQMAEKVWARRFLHATRDERIEMQVEKWLRQHDLPFETPLDPGLKAWLRTSGLWAKFEGVADMMSPEIYEEWIQQVDGQLKDGEVTQ